ncbi:ABC transporter permease [Marinomonas primoryensis]|uniref:ABC transporter permease n=1 Tax=Marinomonas primoryensis TaxID=178399 RepID=A0ABV0L1J1_9GAMM
MSKIQNMINAGYALAIRSIKIQMKEHFLGYAWVLIIPMLYAVCYIFIKRELTGGQHDAETAAFDALRAFSGITLFQFWLQLVQGMSDLIRKQKGMLRGLTVSVNPFVLAIIIESGVALFIRALLIIVAIPLLGLQYPSDFFSWLLFFASLLSLLLTATALGLLLLPWAALYSDVRKLLTTITLPILLISPVFYPAVKDSSSWLYWINSFNPVASPLAVISDVFQGVGGGEYILQMLLGTVISILLITWSLMKLGNQVPILLERVGS